MKTRIFKWKTVLALIGIWISIILNWTWIWGVVFLIWIIPEIRFGRAYFIELVERKENPGMYWLLIITWLLMSIFMITTAVWPGINLDKPVLPTKEISHKANLDSTPDSILIISETIVPDSSLKADSKPQNKPKTEALQFKKDSLSEFTICGVSKKTSHTNNQYIKDIAALWKKLEEENLYEKFYPVPENKIVVTYSDYHGLFNADFTVTIGFKVMANQVIPDGLSKYTVEKGNYAVFNPTNCSSKAVNKRWTEIQQSNLKRSNTNDLEIYLLDEDYNTQEVSIWIAIK